MKFMRPPKLSTDIPKYAHHVNADVNLDNVTSFKKGREAYYPDNEGIPTIEFTFIGGGTVVWYFDRGDESLIMRTMNEISDSTPEAKDEK